VRYMFRRQEHLLCDCVLSASRSVGYLVERARGCGLPQLQPQPQTLVTIVMPSTPNGRATVERMEENQWDSP